MTDLDKFTKEYDFFGWHLLGPEKDSRKRYRRMLYYSMLLMNMLAWCGACFFISAAYHDVLIPDLICVAGIIVYYLIIHLLRTYAKKMWILAAGHILLYFPVIFYVVRTWGMFEEMAAFYLFMLTCCFVSSVLIYQQGGGGSYFGKWYHAAEVVVIYLWGVFRHETRFTLMGLILGIILLLFHFWCTYLTRFNDFIQEQKEVSDFSLENIFRLNTKCITNFLVLAGMLMLAAILARYDAWLEPLKHMLLLVIRYVIRAVQLFLSWLRSLNHPEIQKTGEGDIGTLMPPESGFQTDNLILAVIGGVFITTLFVLGIREFYLKLREILQKQQEAIQQETMIIDRIEELPEEEDPLLKRLARRIFKDNRERVRAQFRHRVKRALKNTIRDSETAGRLHDRVNASGKDQIDALTSLYQVARYSEQKITLEEVRKESSRTAKKR